MYPTDSWLQRRSNRHIIDGDRQAQLPAMRYAQSKPGNVALSVTPV